MTLPAHMGAHDIIPVICSNGTVIVHRKNFEEWDRAQRRAPRFWEVIVGYKSDFGAPQKTLDLTCLGASVCTGDVTHLIGFLRTGHIDAHRIGCAKHVALLFGGCDALDAYETNTIRKREERLHKQEQNPMNPRDDIMQLFEWRVGQTHNTRAWGDDGFHATEPLPASQDYFFRRRRNEE